MQLSVGKKDESQVRWLISDSQDANTHTVRVHPFSLPLVQSLVSGSLRGAEKGFYFQ